jgi:hypothetical protein
MFIHVVQRTDCCSDLYNMLESPNPNKRIKNNDGQARHPGWLSTNTPLSSPVDRTATHHHGKPTPLDTPQTTPSRTTYFDLIHDALNAILADSAPTTFSSGYEPLVPLANLELAMLIPERLFETPSTHRAYDHLQEGIAMLL